MKIIACMLISGALLLQDALRAELVSSGPRNVPFFFSTPLSIDFDSNGVADCSLRFIYYVTQDIPSSGGGGSLSITPAGDAHVLTDGNEVLPLFLLGEDHRMHTNAVWRAGHRIISSFNENLLTGAWTGWSRLWTDRDVGRIAVLFRGSDSRMHVGWVRLLLPDDRGASIQQLANRHGLGVRDDTSRKPGTVCIRSER